MFIGHFGIGLATKKVAPQISLGTLFMAVQFLDLIWPTLLLLNLEQVVIHPELSGNRVLEFSNYPYTHSLLFALLWSVAFGGVYYLINKNRRNALVVGLGVLSHWVIDLIVHFHDLPLYPGHSPLVGFGVWSSMLITSILEASFFIVGIVLYLCSVTFDNNTGRIVFWLLMVFLASVHLWSAFAPPPASVTELAWSAQFQWLFVALAYWADKNATARQSK
jgi:hypothetical protein